MANDTDGIHDFDAEDFSPVYSPRENDIFICYDQADLTFAEQLELAIRDLRRDPWIDTEDIPKEINQDTEAAWIYIEAGIKDSDIFVFILSPDSVNSKQCRSQLALADSLNKRIVPVCAREMNSIEIPPSLKNIEPSFLADFNTLKASPNQIAQMIIDIHIYDRLLDRATEWRDQGYTQELLLRSRDLESLEAWISKNITQNSQLSVLQKQFIKASQVLDVRSTETYQPDVFISYSRRDKEFVERLLHALKRNGLKIWIDWENIPVASDWRQEIYEGIEAANSFIFVISDDSVSSPYCQEEIEHAVRNNKRLIPILWRRDYDRNAVDLSLRKFNWLTFDDFDSALLTLLETINTDLDYVKTHTRLLLRAHEWERRSKNEDLLLRGSELEEARNWLASSASKSPEPLLLHGQFLAASVAAEAKAMAVKVRTRRMFQLLIALLASALGLGFFVSNMTAKVGDIQTLVASLEGSGEGLNDLLVALRAADKQRQTQWLIDHTNPDLQPRVVTNLYREINDLREINRFRSDEHGRIYNVSFSPDGKLVAAANQDGTVGLWQADGKLIRFLPGHVQDVISVAFNPGFTSDAKQLQYSLASASRDGTVRLWSIQTTVESTPEDRAYNILPAKVLQVSNPSQGNPAPLFGLVFSSGGQELVTTSADGYVKLWTKEGVLLASLRHGSPVYSVSFSPFGRLLASGGFDGTVKVWNQQGELITTLAFGSPVLSVSFSADGKSLAAGGGQGIIKVWTLESLQRPPVELKGHTKDVYRVSFSPNSQILASASEDRTARLWNRDGAMWQPDSQSKLLEGHQAPVYRVQFSSDSQAIVTASSDGTIRIWRGDDGTFVDTFEGHQDEILGIAFSPNNRTLASASADRTIRIWRLGNPIQSFSHNNRVYDVDFDPTGKVIASSGIDTIRLWRVQDGSQLTEPIKAHEGEVSQVEFAPKDNMDNFTGQILASAGKSEIKLWKLKRTASSYELEPLITLKSHNSEISSIVFSPPSADRDSQLFASADKNGVIKLWRVKYVNNKYQASLVRSWQGHKGTVHSLSFSPKRQWLASAGEDGRVRFWQLNSDETNSAVAAIPAQDGPVYSVSFSPDGQLFASAGADKVIRLWQMDGTLLHELRGHGAQVVRLDFSADSSLLASASRDQTVKVWMTNGELLTTLTKHRREVSSVSFGRDSSVLASAGFDRSVYLWRLPTGFGDKVLDQLLNDGCNLLREYLSTNSNTQTENSSLCLPFFSHQPDEEFSDLKSDK